MPTPTNLLALLKVFPATRALVVGDAVLDDYWHGRAARLSREAPIPVLEWEGQQSIPGGACNPAANIAAVGGRVIQAGIIGVDAEGERLRELLSARGIIPDGLITDATRQTTTKTRIMAHMGLRFPQQVARIDRVSRHPLSETSEHALIAVMESHAERVQAIILSDYLSGAVTAKVAAAARQIGAARGLFLAADAQGDLAKFAGFDMVKCNADELQRYSRQAVTSNEEFAAVGRQLAMDYAVKGVVLVTRGAEGISLCPARGEAFHLPAPQVTDVYDTVGAGDTVLAVVSMARLAGGSYAQSAALANLAAGIVIRKVGNYTPSLDELREAVAMREEGQG
ncbi:MAG TPA: bifunctional ADP-heptose synthase [Aggregatilineales bacterium]|nr:ribokinase [Anaerolineales bacterium]HRE48132.1 bifunctional ADP-heptose synthase [Aggregatilineales bacterium]